MLLALTTLKNKLILKFKLLDSGLQMVLFYTCKSKFQFKPDMTQSKICHSKLSSLCISNSHLNSHIHTQSHGAVFFLSKGPDNFIKSNAFLV